MSHLVMRPAQPAVVHRADDDADLQSGGAMICTGELSKLEVAASTVVSEKANARFADILAEPRCRPIHTDLQ